MTRRSTRRAAMTLSAMRSRAAGAARSRARAAWLRCNRGAPTRDDAARRRRDLRLAIEHGGTRAGVRVRWNHVRRRGRPRRRARGRASRCAWTSRSARTRWSSMPTARTTGLNGRGWCGGSRGRRRRGRFRGRRWRVRAGCVGSGCAVGRTFGSGSVRGGGSWGACRRAGSGWSCRGRSAGGRSRRTGIQVADAAAKVPHAAAHGRDDVRGNRTRWRRSRGGRGLGPARLNGSPGRLDWLCFGHDSRDGLAGRGGRLLDRRANRRGFGSDSRGRRRRYRSRYGGLLRGRSRFLGGGPRLGLGQRLHLVQ
jgi:hypothetical protein